MKLLTPKGELILPSDFSFTLEHNSPIFSQEGSQSIPVKLPVQNNALLDYPDRPRSSKYNKKLAAKIVSGVFQKNGQLVVEAGSVDDGIIAAIMINESDLYSQIKDTSLPEVFATIERKDISGVNNWVNHIYDSMVNAYIDDFTAFPVAVNFSDEKYSLLNGPDTSSSETPWKLRWQPRRVTYDGQAVNVPAGYGLTPFLFLSRLIELLFLHFGYTVRANPFNDGFLKKIVVINNTADSICKGFVNYADLVPSCSIADFIKWLSDKFLMHLYVYPEHKIVDIIPVVDVIKASSQMDVTPKIDGHEKYIYTEQQELRLSSDTSLDKASPATETIFDFARKYPYLTELSEAEFRSDAWKYNVVKRLSTGGIYEVLRRYNYSGSKIVHLGSNYFSYYSGRFKEVKYDAKDIMPPMVEVKLGIKGDKELNIVCPYIGESRHRNTSLKEKKEAAEQKIIIALYAGLSDENNNIEAKYCLGTTQKFNNLGVQWSQHDLTQQSLYTLLFKDYNSILMNSSIEVHAKVDFSIEELLSIKLNKPIMIRGQKAIIKKLNYNISDKRLENVSSEYILTRSLTPMNEDVSVSFAPQLYRWSYESDADEVFAEFDTQEWSDYTWEYIGPESPSAAAYEFITPPTHEQFLSGEKYYQQSNAIRIAARMFNNNMLIKYFDRVLTSWFRAVEID